MADTEAPDATQPAQITPDQQTQAAAAAGTTPVPAEIENATPPNMGAGAPPAMPAPPQPSVVRQGALSRIVDEFHDAIAGPDGDTGSKWGRVIGTAAEGAAAGYAAGRGAGHGGDAAEAGVKAGEHVQEQRQQQQKDQTEEQRQAKLDQFNYTMLQQKILMNQFDLTHMKQQATQDDINFANERVAEEEKLNSSFLGTFSGLSTLPEVQKAHPEVLKDFYNKKDVQVIPHIDPETGKHDGVSVYLRRPGLSEALLPPGQKITTATMDSKGMWQLGNATTSTPMKQSEIDTANNAAHVKVGTQQNALATDEFTKQKRQADLDKEKAQTAEARAQTSKAIAEAAKARSVSADDPNVATVGELVARAGLTEDQMSKMKGGLLTAVQVYLAQHHPNLDQTSVFLTASDRNTRKLAQNSLQNVDDLASRLQNRPDLLGKINGLVTRGSTLTGTDDKDIAAINEILDNFGLATTGTHGTKAQLAREDARKAILNGFKNGPAATMEAIGEARKSLKNLADVGKPKGINGQPYVYNTQPAAAAAPPASQRPAPPTNVPATWLFVKTTPTDPGQWLDPAKLDAAKKQAAQLQVVQ